MKLTDLKEMTMRAGSMENLGLKLKNYEAVLNNGEHVGNIPDITSFYFCFIDED